MSREQFLRIYINMDAIVNDSANPFHHSRETKQQSSFVNLHQYNEDEVGEQAVSRRAFLLSF